MSKKFDKISPKNISEEKFNQLIESLPSSGLVGQESQSPELKGFSETINNSALVEPNTHAQTSTTGRDQSTGSNLVQSVEEITDEPYEEDDEDSLKVDIVTKFIEQYPSHITNTDDVIKGAAASKKVED